ncbi:uncharacterized protein CELE_T04F8.9 [Caenorhabditis elegans]|uniref:Uncharacterized protein n=1 Tax=Caenorhabditis elegans TaxID=6239 RepID=A0A8S4QDH3_CAEEL|nr:Uncharacterized protein CELE_T04F8.9 [Caenorhabditis elegans]CAH2193604.1 Uncharacterized protein CELE_T04F8.9 [Caenorhabditis elegans]
MASFQPSTRIVTLIIVILAALTCTLFSLVCLGHDATIAALTVTAIVLSGIGIIMLTFFITDKKPCQSDVVLNTVRSNFQHDLQLTDRPPLPPYLPETPTFIPPFPIPPPQIIMESTNILIQPPSVNNPPSYDESADIEDRRITDNSNAPPAYNPTNFVSDNNIASFSPPPYYSPPSPFFGTSVQTSTMYLSAEDMSESPTPTSPIHRIYIRAPSPVRRHPARKPRRQSPRVPKPQETVIVMEQDNSEASTSTSVPKTPTRTPLPQMFIDCSKAEPALFTINGGLWDN